MCRRDWIAPPYAPTTLASLILGTCQANDRSGKGQKYKSADGLLLDFKQVRGRGLDLHRSAGRSLLSRSGFRWLRRSSRCSMLPCCYQVLLRSKALETSIESSIVSNLGHEHHEALSSVMATFLSACNTQMLASQLVRLAGLLSDDAD